jgi:alkylhydroperoxidase family enzyme
MPRIEPVAREALPPALRRQIEKDEADGRDPALNGVMAHLPELFQRYFAFYYPAHEHGAVEARIKELARLRIARLNGCLGACGMARYAQPEREGLDEATIAQLDLPPDEQRFSARERLAIEFAERFATDHLGIDDDFVARLRAEFSDPQLLELGMMIGQYVGFGRLLVVLGIQNYSRAPYRAGLG